MAGLFLSRSLINATYPVSGNQFLLDFGFLELDMLLRNRIIFAHAQLFGLSAGVFLGDIEITGVSGRSELHFNRYGFSHGRILICDVTA